MGAYKTFLKAWIRSPATTGAILPSSRHLSRVMASYTKAPQNNLVVELGAGTGVITSAMIKAGISPKQIIAIEYSANLAKKLKERFPGIEVITGDAADLKTLLQHRSQAISTIISGLPLRSLPKATSQAIMEQIPGILAPGGRYIQFTYDLRRNTAYYPVHYQLIDSAIVWRNIPPAKVDVFDFQDSRGSNLILPLVGNPT